MNSQELKQKIRSTFDEAAPGYDKPALRYFAEAAEQLAEHMGLAGDERLLDVATGTGAVALACARRLGGGQVIGIDLSEGMLGMARAKATQAGLNNLDFRCADLEALPFAAGDFDAACCGFGVFFLPDMADGLRRIATVVKPGGSVGISSFAAPSFEPLSACFLDRIQACGITVPPLSWKRLDHPDKHHDLFAEAGLEHGETRSVPLGYYLNDANGWWDILWNTGFRGLLNQFSPLELEAFREEHLREIAAHATEQGLWLEMEVLITVGRKPTR